MSTESRILRDRQAAAAAALDRSADHAPFGSAALLVKTTTVTTYPTTAARMYGLLPLDIDGDEIEGAAATYTASSDTVLYGVNLGTAIPASGTRLVAHAVGGRWCFRFD